MEEELLRRIKELQALNETFITVNQSLELDEVISSAMKKTMDALELDTCTFYLTDEKTKTLKIRNYNGFSEEFMKEVEILEIGKGFVGKAAESMECIIVEDIQTHPRITRRKGGVREGIKSLITLPLISKEKLIGMMTFGAKKEIYKFSPEKVEFLKAIGNQLAIAVDNAQLHNTLKEARDYLNNLIQSSTDAIISTDERGNVVVFNEGAEKMTGYTAEEIIGRPITELYGGFEKAKEVMKAMYRKGGRIVNYETELKIKGDRLIPVLISATQFKDEQGKVVGTVGYTKDITEHRKMEEEILQHNQELLALNSIARAVSQSLNLDETIGYALDEVVKLMPWRSGSLRMLEEETQELVFKAQKGQYLEGFKALDRLKVGEGIAGQVALTGKLIAVEDLVNDPRVPERGREATKKEGVKSLISIPLISKGKVVGTMEFIPEESYSFTSRDLNFLTIVGSYIGVAIENANLYEKTKAQALRDPLTSLYNRRYFLQRLEEELARFERSNKALSLLLCDLDNLKGINDLYGHPQGDRALVQVARTINENIRLSDIPARYGGDEFAIILPETDSAGAMRVAQRIKEGIRDAFFQINSSKSFHITMSIGMATYPWDVKSIEDLISKTDQAMYKAKKDGGDRIYCIERSTSSAKSLKD